MKQYPSFHTIDAIRKTGLKFRDNDMDKISSKYIEVLDSYEKQQETVVKSVIEVLGIAFFFEYNSKVFVDKIQNHMQQLLSVAVICLQNWMLLSGNFFFYSQN